MRIHNVAAQLSPARPCIHVKPSWPVTSTNVFHPDGRGLAVGIFKEKRVAAGTSALCGLFERANNYSVLKYKTKPEFSTFCRLVSTAMQITADRRHALPINDHPDEIWLWRTQRRRFHMNTEGES